MKQIHWIAIAVGALVVGILLGYAVWGPSAGRLPEVEKELSTTQTHVADFKKKSADMEANLGKITNEKLNLEKEVAELKEELDKAKKRR